MRSSVQLKVCPPPDLLFNHLLYVKAFSATGYQEAIWLQILKTNYNDKNHHLVAYWIIWVYKETGHSSRSL